MTRLIDADALKKALKSNCKPELCHDINTAWCERCCRTNDFEDLIDEAPTVTPIDEAFSTAIDKYGDNTFSVSVISSKGEKIDFKRVKRGKWIEEDKPWGGFDDFVLALTCSECGESFVYHGNNPKFCPECGADMRGGQDNDPN